VSRNRGCGGRPLLVSGEREANDEVLRLADEVRGCPRGGLAGISASRQIRV